MFQKLKGVKIPFWIRMVIYLGLGVLFVSYNVRLFYIMGMDSDYANLILEASDIVRGNFFLNDWIQTGISFLTTDLIYYIIAVAVKGATREAYWLSSGLMTSCMVFSAIPLLRIGKNRKHKLTEDIVFWGICGIPSIVGLNLLRAHTGVYVWIFIAVACFYKIYVDENNKYSALFVFSLVMGTIGDAVILLVAVLPMLLYCFRDLLSNKPKALKKDILLAGLAVGSVIIGALLDKLYYLIGAATKNSYLEERAFEDFSSWPNKIGVYLHAVFGLNSADFTQQSLMSVNTLFFFIKVLVVLFSFVIITIHIVHFIKGTRGDVIGELLSLGFVLISIIFIITNISVNINSARYIGACPVLFALLIVRFMRDKEVFDKRFAMKRIPVWIVAGVLSIVLLIHSFMPLSQLQVPDSEQERVVSVLEENGLKCGYANFWDSSLITVLSEGHVKIRAVSMTESMDLYAWGCKKKWYKKHANFVLVRNPEWTPVGISYDNSIRILGEPERVIDFENYKVLVYGYDISEKINWDNFYQLNL